MSSDRSKVEEVDAILRRIVDDWYERVKENYVTQEDGRLLGVEPEVKRFHELGNHRIKFARERELDVTYGLRVLEEVPRLLVEASVNNKSSQFDYAVFVSRLVDHYLKNRYEKPWTEAGLDRLTYGDLLEFEPKVGRSVILENRAEKADVIRLRFPLNGRNEELLFRRTDLFRDLIESYCLSPLKRIYAESLR